MNTDKKKEIVIQWLEDEYDCEICGGSYAEGASVEVVGEFSFTLEPIAHCYSGQTYDPSEVYTEILKRLGYSVIHKEGE